MHTAVGIKHSGSRCNKSPYPPQLRLPINYVLTILLLMTADATSAQSINSIDTSKNRERQTTIPQLYTSMSLNRTDIYVSEQLSVTVELLSPASAFNIRTQKLAITGADIFILGKQTVDTTRDAVPYRLETTSYAIYFKEPGQYIIPSLQTTATLPVSAGGANANSNPKLIIQSALRTVTVNKAPVAALEWLPASELAISAHWQTEGKAPKFIAGIPVTRNYTFKVQGQFPTAIPEPEFTFPEGIRHYLNPPLFEKLSDKSGVRGSLVQVVNLIPDQAGEYMLPSLTVKWWDINQQSWKSATVPEESIAVLPAQADSNSIHHQTHYKTYAILLAILSVALACCCLLLWQLLRRATRSPAPPINTEKQKWKALDKALKAENALEVRQALTAWYTAIRQSPLRYRIDQLAGNDQDMHASLQQLEASIFSYQGNRDINFDQLTRQLRQQRRSLLQQNRKKSARNTKSRDALHIKLYPSS